MADDRPSELRVRDPDALHRYDADDRRQPTRLSGFAWLAAFKRSGLQHRVVPEDFWTLGTSKDGRASVATVKCPCGHVADVELAAYPTKCQCERWFFFLGGEVWSLASPTVA